MKMNRYFIGKEIARLEQENKEMMKNIAELKGSKDDWKLSDEVIMSCDYNKNTITDTILEVKRVKEFIQKVKEDVSSRFQQRYYVSDGKRYIFDNILNDIDKRAGDL